MRFEPNEVTFIIYHIFPPLNGRDIADMAINTNYTINLFSYSTEYVEDIDGLTLNVEFISRVRQDFLYFRESEAILKQC